MFKNVKHNNVRSLNLKLRNDKYYDFMLYRGECVTVGNSDGCVVADIKPYNMSKGKVYSEREWEEAVNNGVTLKNIGFTGMDNGIITFRRDKITNAQFLKLYTESKYNIEEGDKRFFMFPVTGNSNQYKYFYSLEDDDKGGFITLNGGFLQGFYKLFGEEYQTLPNHIENDMNFEFVLRRKDYDVHYRTINHTHPNNNGIFFYMGTRAENKFWLEYKRKDNVEDLLDTENHHGGYFEDYIPSLDNVIETDYFLKDIEKLELNLDSGYNSRCNCNADYITNGYSCDLYFASNEKGGCIIDGYFDDAYTGDGNLACDCDVAGYSIGNEYYEQEISLKDLFLTTDKGHELNKRGYFEIKTDNKFVTFDQTKYGFTTKTFDPENPYIIYEGRNDWGNLNYFVLMNQTPTGYTVDTIKQYHEENVKEFDIYKDIRDNAFALKINEDGSISYRYGMTDCDSETKYKVEEETSKANLIPMDEWVTINVRISMLTPNDECDNMVGKRRMKIFIYVNGNLVFISKELPEFKFRELDDVKEKQETVPFNMSLGGGTQGLCDAIWLNYYSKPDYMMPLERDFCGSFLGDIKSFKIYDCFLDYKTINDNVFGV